ncbi:MAG: hypothetical protein IT347_06895 [Candidatus Eisenbacteria bacterium]|nr:hypothetical protein [Candidatus Eisenbacteria bacterium]
MGVLNLLLHTLHIAAGVLWAGGAILMGLFIVPSVLATRPESGRFMQELTGPRRLLVFLPVVATITVVCGLAMFSPALGNLDAGVMRSPRGIALSLGALLALGAYFEGLMVNTPSASKLGRLGRAIAASGAAPTAEQAQQAQALQTKLARGAARGAWMLIVAVICMAAARWL